MGKGMISLPLSGGIVSSKLLLSGENWWIHPAMLKIF
jgi:hypothetical protein